MHAKLQNCVEFKMLNLTAPLEEECKKSKRIRQELNLPKSFSYATKIEGRKLFIIIFVLCSTIK